MSQYKQLLQLDTEQQQQLLAEANQLLLSFTPAQRVQWALTAFAGSADLKF